MRDTRWLEPEEDGAWRGYRRMRTLLDLQLARDLARESGLSESDYDVLSTLSEHDPPRWRANDLAGQLMWSASRLAHHVGRMQRRGLVSREASPEDGRGAVVGLTDQGWQTLRRAAPAHLESVRRHFVDLLTAHELTVLASITRKVNGKLAGTVGPAG